MSKETVADTRSPREKKLRKQIWQAMTGCECRFDLPSEDRCDKRTVRCHARYRVILEKLTEHRLRP